MHSFPLQKSRFLESSVAHLRVHYTGHIQSVEGEISSNGLSLELGLCGPVPVYSMAKNHSDLAESFTDSLCMSPDLGGCRAPKVKYF